MTGNGSVDPAKRGRWWDGHTCSVNGIFKGGGAKGLLYAGALEALADRNRWFRAVAGSSAGAITATLIAAGMTTEQLRSAVPEALGKIKRNWLGDLIGRPIVGTVQLREWLAKELEKQVEAMRAGPRSQTGPVTFKELYEATHIGLYVVCVDVASRQPIIFNARSTPELAVADAVMASSAIPLAFRPGRLRVQVNGVPQVHRLMDGGVWANYPAFVFKDPSFRAFHDLEEVPASSVTIGFTIEHPTSSAPGTPIKLLTKWALDGDRGSLLRGWLQLAPVRLYFMTIVPLVIAAQTLWTIDRYGLVFLTDNIDESTPVLLGRTAYFFNGFFISFYLGYIPVAAFLGLMAALLLFLGATLLDSAVPAMRTLMAVGTNVPYWVGTAPGDHLVRLHVPPGLGTLTFNLSPDLVAGFVQGARTEAEDQLQSILAQTS